MAIRRNRPKPFKQCKQPECLAQNPTGVRHCVACGAKFYLKGRIRLADSIKLLMRAASFDVRNGTEQWRREVSAAWATCHRKVYGCEPCEDDYRKAGMTPPVREE